MRTVIADVETGGVLESHPTIQLAAIVVDESWHEVASFEQKIAFDAGRCDPDALALNHYDPEAWEDALAPHVVAAKFAAFVRPYCDVKMVSKRPPYRPYAVAQLAGYNALTFDLPRIKALFGTSFFPCSFLVRDVLQRVLWHYDEQGGAPENFKLSTVAAALGIDTAGAHDALADVRLTAAVYRALRWMVRPIGSPWHEADPLPLGAWAYAQWSAAWWRAVSSAALSARKANKSC